MGLLKLPRRRGELDPDGTTIGGPVTSMNELPLMSFAKSATYTTPLEDADSRRTALPICSAAFFRKILEGNPLMRLSGLGVRGVGSIDAFVDAARFDTTVAIGNQAGVENLWIELGHDHVGDEARVKHCRVLPVESAVRGFVRQRPGHRTRQICT